MNEAKGTDKTFCLLACRSQKRERGLEAYCPLQAGRQYADLPFAVAVDGTAVGPEAQTRPWRVSGLLAWRLSRSRFRRPSALAD
jgi:hypothetical protein